MNPQTQDRIGNIPDKSYLSKIAGRVLFLNMFCNPVILLVYYIFCRTLYRFCMYGGVKKRGSVLIVCFAIFVVYWIFFFVRVRKIKIMEGIPENMPDVRNYGFYKRFFYATTKEHLFFIKECTDEEKDYLKIKYLQLPRYKAGFWKIPVMIIVVMITVMTVIGVVKSATGLNGKLSWYLYRLQHPPVVSESIKAE